MTGNLFRLLDRDRTIAGPGFNRWPIPPAALAVHLCIGEVYGFSVFNGPLTRVVGITRSIAGRDWTIPQVGWIYSIAPIVPRPEAYSATMYPMSGLLLAGLACNLLVRPVAERHHHREPSDADRVALRA